MNISRRDLLKFAAGSAAGVILSPLPWKLVDDSAIWTQNWPWIPKPAAGESTFKFTTCSLCPAACGMRARCIGAQPVSLSGVPEHPLSHGSLCPIGLGGHHLPYHPARVLQPVRRVQKFGAAEVTPLSIDEAVNALNEAIAASRGAGMVAVLDQRPGRIISGLYRQFLGGLPNGSYLIPSPVENAASQAYASMFDSSPRRIGMDLEHSRTIVSFGAPLMDGWGTPGRMMQLLKQKPSLFQIEPRLSRTASMADEWIPVRPGTESIFALTLAQIIVDEKLYDTKFVQARATDFDGAEGRSYRGFLRSFTPEITEQRTGVSPVKARSLAHTMATQGPTVVIGGGDPAGGPLGRETEIAIAGLNLLLGNMNREGGLILSGSAAGQSSLSPAMPLHSAADHSIRVLIMDGAESGNAIPWSLIERKLADEKSLVVSLSPYMTGHAKRAGLLIPTPAFLETWQDVPTPFDMPVETFSVSTPLLPAPAGCVDSVDLVQRMASSAGVTLAREATGASLLDDLRLKAREIQKAGKGSVFSPADKKMTLVAEIGSEDAMWTLLSEGGCWMGAPSAATDIPRFSFFGKEGALRKALTNAPIANESYPLVLMPFGWRGTTGSGQFSPLMTKLFQESGLRKSESQAFLNPQTAADAGIIDGSRAMIGTSAGSMPVLAHVDKSVMPGVIHVAVGPDPDGFRAGATEVQNSILMICTLEGDPTWRVTAAKAWGA